MQVLYTKATDKMMSTIKEAYLCHYTAKETAVKYGFSYTQINTVFYKFRAQKLQKYDRRFLPLVNDFQNKLDKLKIRIEQLEEYKHASHSARA